MLSVDQKKPYLLTFLLACLIASPTAPLVAASTPPEVETELRLSDELCSPLRGDVLHIADPWLNIVYNKTWGDLTDAEKELAKNHLMLLSIMASGRQQKNYAPTSRLSLLTQLQFANSLHKRAALSNINTTITAAGKMSLFNLCAQEVTDWKIIKARQKFIKLLIDTPELLEETQNSLKKIHTHEENFYRALKLTPTLTMPTFNTIRSNNAPLEMLVMLIIALVVKACEKHDSLRTAATHAATISMGSLIASCAAASIGSLHYAATSSDNLGGAALATAVSIVCGGATAALAYTFKEWRKNLLTWFKVAQSAAQTLRNALQMQEALASNDATAEYYPDLFDEPSTYWKDLQGKVQSSTFNEEAQPWLFLTNHGRAANTINRMKSAHSEIGTLARFYGELDAYQSIAQFYINTKEATNTYGEPTPCCLVDFIDDSPTSILHAKFFWNPLIPQDRVRPSSLFLGETNEPRNLVITGPNAGGKSVNLKALLTNLVFAQTFGIACAKSFRFTPFKKIIARLESPDNTADDKSKFMLEAIEMAGLLKEMMSLKPNEHAFVETDELFTGTEVGPAINLSLELCAQIAKIKNVMYILATHYKELSELKHITNNTFDNYKVSVTKKPETGELHYPYTLSPGVGNTNVAFDIFLHQLQQLNITDATLIEVIRKAKARQEAAEAQMEAHLHETSPQPISVA